MSETRTAAERRVTITGEIVSQTGLNEATIERLVRQFYAEVRRDPILGPIFDDRISDWEPHLQRMCEFWSSVMLMSGRYHGNAMVKHLPLPIDSVHFDRWLALFEEACRKVCTPAAAAYFVERARRIAESLELGIAGRHGVLLRKGERFCQPEHQAAMTESAWPTRTRPSASS